mmetsp:Transcript_61355/g.163106  ORF Transcript_61355/g.163106 Transcript_61355/m.163106 type:complete len:200 (-) Transcript_61355:1955-2554(-)
MSAMAASVLSQTTRQAPSSLKTHSTPSRRLMRASLGPSELARSRRTTCSRAASQPPFFAVTLFVEAASVPSSTTWQLPSSLKTDSTPSRRWTTSALASSIRTTCSREARSGQRQPPSSTPRTRASPRGPRAAMARTRGTGFAERPALALRTQHQGKRPRPTSKSVSPVSCALTATQKSVLCASLSHVDARQLCNVLAPF